MCAGRTASREAALTARAARALFTAGHLSLETARMPPADTVKAIQALTLPSHLDKHAAALSPKLTPGYAAPWAARRCGRPRVPGYRRDQNTVHSRALHGADRQSGRSAPSLAPGFRVAALLLHR